MGGGQSSFQVRLQLPPNCLGWHWGGPLLHLTLSLSKPDSIYPLSVLKVHMGSDGDRGKGDAHPRRQTRGRILPSKLACFFPSSVFTLSEMKRQLLARYGECLSQGSDAGWQARVSNLISRMRDEWVEKEH